MVKNDLERLLIGACKWTTNGPKVEIFHKFYTPIEAEKNFKNFGPYEEYNDTHFVLLIPKNDVGVLTCSDWSVLGF